VSLPPTYARVITGLAVLAVILAVLLLGDLSGDDARDTATEPTPTATPTSPPPPTSVSAEDFCAAFNVMAAAQANHLANDTEASLVELRAATTQLMWLAQAAPMGPQARQGLQEMVDGVLGESTEPPDQAAADALSAYLEVACRPGGL
jgi:hypothetical protein